jgi:hypothetical protein
MTISSSAGGINGKPAALWPMFRRDCASITTDFSNLFAQRELNLPAASHRLRNHPVKIARYEIGRPFCCILIAGCAASGAFN